MASVEIAFRRGNGLLRTQERPTSGRPTSYPKMPKQTISVCAYCHTGTNPLLRRQNTWPKELSIAIPSNCSRLWQSFARTALAGH